MVGDKRNFLYKYYLKFLSDLSPNFFLFENVPGLFSAGNGQYLKNMLKGMRKLGYEVPEPRLVNTSEYNVPQNRKRVIVVGWKRALNFNIESVFKKPNPISFCVNDFLSDLPKLNAGESKTFAKYTKNNHVIKQLGIASNEGFTTENITRPHNDRDLAIYRIAVDKLKKGEKLKYNELPEQLKTHKNQKSFLDRFKVVPKDLRASHTVVAHISKDGHYYIHPDIKQNRSLSVREAARLQTFPDNFKFEGSRTSMYRQIGNAVPVLLTTCLAKNISEQLSQISLKEIA